MLEGLVAWVLNNYLGKYVENLNTDQLSIALLQGAVELENLPLRKDALRHIGLPIEVRAGFIGKIRLKVPVSQIRSAPWEISIDQLYLVTGPVRLSEWDEEAEEQAAYEYKLSLLDAIEARWRAETDTAPEYSYYASSYSSWLSYGTSLATNIVDNLQLKISDVHFRYEDDQTLGGGGAGLVLGLQIESLTARSCDEAWMPGAASRDRTSCFKLLQLANLAVYWDDVSKDQMMSDLTIPELSVAMGKKAADQNHSFLLVPVSAEAQTKRNRSDQPLRSRTQPRIVCDLKFDQVRLTLSDRQFGQMVACVKMLDSVMLSQRYRKHRPSVAVTEDPRAWWRYACTCITTPRQTWATMHTRAKENIAYVDIYSKLLHTSTASAPLPPENKQLKDKVEWERGFEELRALREVAMCRVRPPPLPDPPSSHSQGRSVLFSWFPQWWGWYSTPPPADASLSPEPPPDLPAPQQSSEVSQTLEDEILDALADSVENSTLLKRDTVFAQVNFTINQGTFNLCNENQKSLMELQFERVRLGLESRPRTGSHCVTVMLGGLSLHDNLTQDSAFPVLISPQSSESAPSGRPARNLPPGLQRLLNQSSEIKEEPLFHFLYEYRPFNSPADFRLQIHSQALDVVYNPSAVKWLIDFFVRPFQSSDPSFRAAARQGYNAMKQRTKQELLRNWDRILQGHQTARKTWDVDLAISAPQIFLVEHFNDKNAVLCVVDLGKLHLTNREPQLMEQRPSVVSNGDDETEEAFQTPCSTPPGSEASNSISPVETVGSPVNQTFDSGASISELAIHHKLYDRYSVDLNELQILVGRVRDNWKFAHLKGTSALHVLDRFSISFQMERRIVYTTDPQFPSLTFAGNLPKLVVHINEQKIQAICTLVDVISGRGLPSPFRSAEGSPEEEPAVVEAPTGAAAHPADDVSDSSGARLLMLQFTVDQLALEVQSRSRSVAELQVSGVRVSYTKRPFDTSLSLSVHGLLLVDALQTFGPDFELLVASHKHVGMDSVSGSLRDSEPTSPTSPGSPDPLSGRGSLRLLPTTPPSAITSALSCLQTDLATRAKSPPLCASSPPPVVSPQPPLLPPPPLTTSEALITIELVFTVAAKSPPLLCASSPPPVVSPQPPLLPPPPLTTSEALITIELVFTVAAKSPPLLCASSPPPVVSPRPLLLPPTPLTTSKALITIELVFTVAAKSPPPLCASSPPPVVSPQPPLLPPPPLTTSEALITIELVFTVAAKSPPPLCASSPPPVVSPQPPLLPPPPLTTSEALITIELVFTVAAKLPLPLCASSPPPVVSPRPLLLPPPPLTTSEALITIELVFTVAAKSPPLLCASSPPPVVSPRPPLLPPPPLTTSEALITIELVFTVAAKLPPPLCASSPPPVVSPRPLLLPPPPLTTSEALITKELVFTVAAKSPPLLCASSPPPVVSPRPPLLPPLPLTTSKALITIELVFTVAAKSPPLLCASSPPPVVSPQPPLLPPLPLTTSEALITIELVFTVAAKSPPLLCASSPPPVVSPRPPLLPPLPLTTSEALITIELVFVSADCPTNTDTREHLQIANIQFNNLDIIANQETIVELIGFVKRVFPSKPIHHKPPVPVAPDDEVDNSTGSETVSRRSSVAPPPSTRTQLTFDFHRLNILLLRAVVRDNVVVGRKIATVTLSHAKINAGVGEQLLIEGSLGGLQVLDLTQEGRTHQRVLSLGQDPLTDSLDSSLDLMAHLAADLYSMAGTPTPHSTPRGYQEKEAFSFTLKRDLQSQSDSAAISIRFASVWYTHSPHLLLELQSCAKEFKQYLANLARSIGTAATEMAIGLVHARAESLAQSLSMSSRLYGSTADISMTPRKRRRSSLSQSVEMLDSGQLTATRGTATPFTPEDDLMRTQIQWDVILDTPVVVLPRSADSTQVLVAHLGRMSLTNGTQEPLASWVDDSDTNEHYDIEIRDMNVYTLDIQKHLSEGPMMQRVDKLYNCAESGKPVLHDTVIQLTVDHQAGQLYMRQAESILLETGPEFTSAERQNTVQIRANVVTPLKVSLSRQQYEQVLETVSYVVSQQPGPASETNEPSGHNERPLQDIEEDAELTGVTTLNLDPKLRARMYLNTPTNQELRQQSSFILRASMDLPVLTVELIADLGSGEQGLVDLSFKDLQVQYDKSHPLETNIQMSLRTLLMEDLLQAPDSRHRRIMASSPAPAAPHGSAHVSQSCPDLAAVLRPGGGGGGGSQMHISLPDHLQTDVYGGRYRHNQEHCGGGGKRMTTATAMSTDDGGQYPCTPPPSPRATSPCNYHEDNLVHINVVLRAPRHPSLNMSRHVTIDFNSLDVVVNVESWVVVLDFFGISSTEPDLENKRSQGGQHHPTTETRPAANDLPPMHTEHEIFVRSLSVVFNRADYEVARAVMSQLSARVVASGTGVTDTEASVGSLSLADLTPVHGQLYREKFVTAGLNMVMKKYSTPDIHLIREYDTYLRLDMMSLQYVHTKRFIAELQAFFRQFSQLQRILNSIRSARQISELQGPATRLKLEMNAASPVLFLPMSSRSPEVLVADLGKLYVSNRFLMSGSAGTISTPQDNGKGVLLDVMQIQLHNMDLVSGQRVAQADGRSAQDGRSLGSYWVTRRGGSLLRDKCHMQLQVERNLMTHIAHSVPDMSIQGTLSTLAATVDLDQYKLIKGLLSFNLGECIDDLMPRETANAPMEEDMSNVWLWNSIHLELVDVSVCLRRGRQTLACVNFVKSHLNVDSYSDATQDVDLVSQEILITDTRFLDEPANKRSNIFTNILQPIVMTSEAGTVQAQVHHRRLLDMSKFTILLNNMRLMAILDWWETARDFILENPVNPWPVANNQRETKPTNSEAYAAFEMKLNITNSEIVFVEDTSQWDSNAVILKSTTVITYRPLVVEKPLSCNLNHCEMFSCILGMEDETALSIIDPVTVNIEIVLDNGVKTLKVQMVHLSLRLSYHDVRMFSQMLESVPKQTKWARSHSIESPTSATPANFRSQLVKLSALGFREEDCSRALEVCSGQLDDAALWLTQHAAPAAETHGRDAAAGHNRLFTVIEVDTDCLSVCVIDDCRDADVPLLELTLGSLVYKQDLARQSGSATCALHSDYYNRTLSGWEPFLEPWSCSVQWEKTQERQQVYLVSEDVLNINITSTLVELFNSVKETWTQDYYNPKDSSRCDSTTNLKALGSPPGYRRRSPFVPFALHNDTGSRLWFTTITTSNNTFIDGAENERRNSDRNQQWTAVDPGETVPFSFEERGKMRHRYTHKVTIHQLGVKVEGWQAIDPVTVDRVGVYFRLASPDYSAARSELPQARVVLEVTLEGSARKLVTVRSALQLCNRMSDTVEVKLDNTHIHTGVPLHLTASPGATLSVPLSHAMAQMWVRPLDRAQVPTHYHAFCNRPITWQHVTRPLQEMEELRQCHSNRGNNYKFSVVVRRENYPVERPPPLAPPLSSVWLQPAHTVTLLNALTVVNLLPQELGYSIRDLAKGRIRPGQEAAIHQVDQENQIELQIGLEGYPGGGTLVIPSLPQSFTTKLKMHDQSRRRLQLTAAVEAQQGCGLRVTISAMFWLVNKTGLPLVFRQEGVATETAGQYEEHEVARMVAPLLFSFVDQDASPTVVARVGSKVHPEGTPQWCQHFRLHAGVQVRRLRVSLWDNRPDLVYMIGIDIRPGRGRYRCTNIVTLSAHYQIHNKSSYRIQFAQLCFATTVSDPGAKATYLSAVPDCSLAFHWPRLDKDQLLCLRLMDVPQCHWSGGFKIDNNDSLHINVRDSSGRMYFLRAEIVLQRATYFIVLTDADSMPAPIRIDNFSQVAVQFYQTGVQAVSSVRPHCSVPYAFDEPTRPQRLTVVAPGGVSASYDINKLGEGLGLTYENFIYIAFTGTFKSVGDTVDPLDVQCQQLVLEVPDGSSSVVLSRKQHGARSQLWRMTGEGQLQHEGSSPPRASPDKILVLDISGPAPQPAHYVGLALRRPDKRRSSTQTWRFTEDGRLCCVHNNMCVQAKDGFFGLRQGSEVVLGRSSTTPDGNVPLEQLVSRQRLRPGSGFLTVKVLTDGPTRVLQVTDVKDSRMVAMLEESDWVNVSTNHRPAALLTDDPQLLPPKDNSEYQLNVELPCIGVSLVSRQPPEELMYIKLSQIRLSAMWTHDAEMLDACVQDIQVDNQLFKAVCPVVLHVTPPSRSTDAEEVARPALQITGERVPRRHTSNAEIVKHLVVRMKNMSLNVEERLLLKLFAFLGFSGQDEQETADESDFETQRILAEATSAHAKRYYFGSLKLIFCQVRLSVSTSNKLSEQLKAIKRKLGLTLIKFQDAAVELEPFVKRHIFENSQFLLGSIIKHYKEELKWQAAIILGSTDFLGNPLGFVNDLSEGMSGLIFEGNVGALFKNVTHGLSNSAAKVSESLSDGLGRVVLDDRHEEQRLRIRRGHAGTSRDHLAAGLRGFGFGVLGGVTSVFRQTYEGAANEGIPGFISGLGKGIVGTVTKPVIGFLDLTSEAASAVRITSSNRKSPERTRPPRCVTSGTGLMPLYNQKQSRGQEYLYTINNYDYSELFMAYEVLRSGSEDLRIVISSEMVRVFSGNTFNSFLEVHLGELVACHPLSLYEAGTTLHYIELAIRVEGAVMGQEPIKRPRVRCDTNTIAAWVSQQVNHARTIYIERQHTLMSSSELQNATED